MTARLIRRVIAVFAATCALVGAPAISALAQDVDTGTVCTPVTVDSSHPVCVALTLSVTPASSDTVTVTGSASVSVLGDANPHTVTLPTVTTPDALAEAASLLNCVVRVSADGVAVVVPQVRNGCQWFAGASASYLPVGPGDNPVPVHVPQVCEEIGNNCAGPFDFTVPLPVVLDTEADPEVCAGAAPAGPAQCVDL